MKRLTETPMFQLLSTEGIINPAETTIKPMYDDFVRSVIELCTSEEGEVPTYFTLHYTRLELKVIQPKLSTEGAGKKCDILCLSA